MYAYVCLYVCVCVCVCDCVCDCVCVCAYQDQCTPLHLAAEYGHSKIVETLVEAKADPCAQDEVSVLKETRLDADRGMR